MKTLFILLLISLVACQQTQTKTDKQVLNFGAFTIQAPNSWRHIKQQGIDSYAGRIAIDNHDTLDFDLGWYSNSLSEPEPYIVERRQLQYSSKQPQTQLI